MSVRPPNVTDQQINTFLQKQLKRLGKHSFTATEAASRLDRAGLLRDSSDRPGRELRRLLRDGRIVGARHLPNNRWLIDCVNMLPVKDSVAAYKPSTSHIRNAHHGEQQETAVLPDVLVEDLTVVFCGTAVGNKSSEKHAYYAGPGNKFWRTLHRIGLTPRQLEPSEYTLLPMYGIGLTDLVKSKSGSDRDLATDVFSAKNLREKMVRLSPNVLCFNGKRAAQEYFGRNNVAYGLQGQTIEKVLLFTATSTSGAANGYWDEAVWRELARISTSARLAATDQLQSESPPPAISLSGFLPRTKPQSASPPN